MTRGRGAEVCVRAPCVARLLFSSISGPGSIRQPRGRATRGSISLIDRPFEKLWLYAIRGAETSMETRLFRLVTLATAILCGLLVLPINLLQDLSVYLNVTIGFFALVCTYLHQCSRSGKNHPKTFYLSALFVLNVGWFLNGGSIGSMVYFFLAAILIPLIFFRGRVRFFMSLLLVFDYLAVLAVEHRFPASVLPYKSAHDRLLDLATGFAFSALVIALMFWVVVTSLERELDERRRAERLLTENEATLMMLMDFMPSPIWWFREDGRIEYVNRCFRELFGYDAMGMPTIKDWLELGYPEEEYRREFVAQRNAAVAQAKETGSAVPVRESKITCRDGSIRHVLINTQFVLGRTLEIFTDITERELIQDQMLKVEKLESLGVLAGGIAHDFNNILTGIIGNLSFARLFVDLDHAAASPLLQAEKAAQRAAELAKQLLTFSKGGQPVKAPVEVKNVLEESLSLAMRGTNVQSALAISPRLRKVEADEGQLSQAFNNLIINAVHAMPNGGTLTIGAGNVTLAEVNPWGLSAGDYVRLTFADQGEGIPEKDQKYIFDPYFTTKSGGTGLGLASTHSIVTRHGGHIALLPSTSGAVFCIHLPAMPEEATPDPSAKQRILPVVGGGETILVMDDEEMIRQMAARVLLQAGFLVQTCPEGAEAVALYRGARDRGAPFAAVILDLTVPGGMGGKEAAQQILGLDGDARLIVSTGYSTDISIDEWSWYGFSGFLPKPYAAEDLLHAVVGVIQKRR